jgi:CopG family nickel-responsive transcriptional regulator
VHTSFNVPEAVVGEFDRECREEGIESRSRAVRVAMLAFIRDDSDGQGP